MTSSWDVPDPWDVPEGMRLVRVECEWRSTHMVEVPEDWEWDGQLESIIEWDELQFNVAELTDWEVHDA